MKYYRMRDDLTIKKRWFLGAVENDEDKDPWKYILSKEVKSPSKNLKIQQTSKGNSLDYTFAEFEVPIVNEKVAGLFSEEEVQLIPIEVDGSSEKFFILVVKNEVDCVDESKSDFEVWEENNPIRPDLAGQYNAFFELIVDSKRTAGKRIFRLYKFNIAIIVDETIKKLFEKLKLKGVEFEEV